MGSDFREKTLRGISWSLVSQIGRQSLQFVISIVLARLLSPEEFGLLAMIMVIVNFANIFSELGLSAALVQKQNLEEVHYSSVFWLNLTMGLLLTLMFMGGAPLVAWFYDEPQLISLVWFVSLSFVISSLNIVQNTQLTKALDFRTLSIVEISAVAISGTLAIVLALNGYGVWSLAIQSVTLTIVTAVLLWLLTDWRPSLIFEWSAIRDLMGFSLNLLGNKILNYGSRNIDYLLIGRFLGSTPLGLYNRAYTVMLFPLSRVSRVFSRVMFPSFSTIQNEKMRIKSLFFRITATIALVTFPMMMGLFVVVEPFVLTVFGEQWIDMVPVLRVLSVVGVSQSIITLVGNLYLSQGKTDLQFRLGLLFKGNLILGIVVGLRWGIVGVAVGYTLTSLLNMWPNLYFSGRLIGMRPRELFWNLSGVFNCALFMALAVWGIGICLPTTWPHWVSLLIQVLSGMVLYFLVLQVFKVQAYQQALNLLKEQLKKRVVSYNEK